MTIAAKRYNEESILTSLLEKYDLSPSSVECQALEEEVDELSRKGILPQTEKGIFAHFEPRIREIAERFQLPKAELALLRRSEAIASERCLAPVKLNNSRMLMAYPWFSPDQKPRTEPQVYQSPDGETILEVLPLDSLLFQRRSAKSLKLQRRSILPALVNSMT